MNSDAAVTDIYGDYEEGNLALAGYYSCSSGSIEE